MIHRYRVFIDLAYDDEHGEYPPPTLKQIEEAIGNELYRKLVHMGFMKDYNVEAEKE